MKTSPIEHVFCPRSVAVIGASRDARGIGRRVLHNLIRDGFQGPVFPVNPHADVVASIPAYASVKDVPRAVDMAVIAVPQPQVLGVVDECIAKGVKALVVLTAGFAEVGGDGAKLQAELVQRVRSSGLRMVGPNCLGMINNDPAVSLNATFVPSNTVPGRVAMASQSGALGVAILEYAKDLGLGLSSFVSMGNKADVSSNDLLEYWERDARTDVILLYLESFGNPRKFARIASSVSRKKAILAVKGGRSSAGKRASASHTAALAASNEGSDALFQQAGVIRLDTLEEMFDVASLLAHQPLPRGGRVAILTNAGGPAILCADACEAQGLELSLLTEDTQRALRTFLPSTASVKNPVDMVAAAGPVEYRDALSLLLDDENIDAVIVLFIPAGQSDEQAVSEAIREGRARAKTSRQKPLLSCFMAMGGMTSPLTSREEAIPSFRFPESAARALARGVERSIWLRRPQGLYPQLKDMDLAAARSVCERAILERKGGWLLPEEARQILQACRIAALETVHCHTPQEAVKAAERVGYPVAVKLASTKIMHKSDIGGVRLSLKDRREVEHAVVEILDVAKRVGKDEEAGVVVQPMARDGSEVFVGVTEDPSFGPLVAFGLGGFTVELLKDVVFRIAPLSDQDAVEMVRGIKGY